MKVSILITALAQYVVYENGMIQTTFSTLKGAIDYCNTYNFQFSFAWAV